MKRIALVSVVVFLAAAPALAQTARPWISANTAFGWYDPTDVNRQVQELRDEIEFAMDDVSSGFQLGAAAGLELSNGWTVGGGYQRLYASTQGSTGALKVEYDVPADVIHLFGRYTFQRTGATRSFAEGSLGFLSTDGRIRSSFADETHTFALEGTGWSLEGSFGFERRLTPALAVTACVGGRKAKALDVTGDGVRLSTPRGDEFVVDYSGVFLRAALQATYPRH
ncbi:MAG: outer membrane beta-barrel protein [Candidatus Eisenbacteria bacterium]